MIDLHCHILPGLDDGAATDEQAIAMARLAVQDGITAIIATPHHRDGEYDNEQAVVRQGVERFNELLREHEIPLCIFPGQEIRCYDALADDLNANGKIQTLNDSRYLLLEFPPDEVPREAGEVMHELFVAGLVPVIAHPERNKAISQRPELLLDMVESGALAQVTSHSLIGKFGRKVQQTAVELCRRHLIHVVASDAHSVAGRPFHMKEAMRTVRRTLGESYEAYYLQNAQCIFQNEQVERLTPKTEKWKFISKMFKWV